MSQWSKMYKVIQDSNPEKFDERIMNLKDEDSVIDKIIDACKSLESVEGVHFISANKMNNKKIYKFQKEPSEMNYEDSRVDNYEINFELEKDGEFEKVKNILSFPKLMEGCYIIIDDVKYFQVFQLFDAEIYKTGKSMTTRTSLQPIVVCKAKSTVTDINLGIEINNLKTFSSIFSVKMPIMIYFFAKLGVLKTIKYFNLPFEITDDEEEIKNADEDTMVFKLGKKFLKTQLYLKVPFDFVDEEVNPNYENNEILLLTFIDAFNKDKFPIECIDDEEFFVKKLGSYFTKNSSNFYNKGQAVQISFERLFDDTTKKIIRLEDSDKKDIYSLIRWMLTNYNHLLKMNNNDLANKRLRLNECYIYPLLEKWTDGVLRLLNGRKTKVKNLKTLFSNLKQDFLVKKCTVSDNLRYSNLVNTIDISARLKVTSSGPQSISTNSGEIKGKDLDPSMIGNIDLIYTSNADPGTTRMLTPFAKVNDSWHFSDKPKFISSSFEGDYEIEDDFELTAEDMEMSDFDFSDF